MGVLMMRRNGPVSAKRLEKLMGGKRCLCTRRAGAMAASPGHHRGEIVLAGAWSSVCLEPSGAGRSQSNLPCRPPETSRKEKEKMPVRSLSHHRAHRPELAKKGERTLRGRGRRYY